MLLEVRRRKVKRSSQNRVKRNVILAISLVLERESAEMADFLSRKSLYKCLYAIKKRGQQRAVTRQRMENA